MPCYTIEYQSDFERLELEYGNILTSLEIYREDEDWQGIVDIISGLDLFCDGKGYWQLLKFWLDIAWNKRNFIHEQSKVLKILLSLAQMCSTLGERKRAIGLYEEAIGLARKLKDDTQLAFAYFGLGTVYHSKAVQSWKKGKSFARKSGDEIQLAGINYFLELETAEGSQIKNQKYSFLQNHITKVFSNMGEVGESALLMLQASRFLVNEEIWKAQPMFERALFLFKNSGERQGEALALFNLGIIAQRQNRMDDALVLYEDSLHIAEELQDNTGLAGLYSSLGFLQLQRQEWTSSRYYLEKGLVIIRANEDEKSLAENLYWFGYALANTGDVDQAIQVFTECQEILRRLGKRNLLDPEKQLSILQNMKSSY